MPVRALMLAMLYRGAEGTFELGSLNYVKHGVKNGEWDALPSRLGGLAEHREISACCDRQTLSSPVSDVRPRPWP